MLYTLLDGNEDMGFKRLDTFDVFPTVIIDMIFMYAYNMTKQDLHHHVILAKSASHRMPVPRAWKRYINPSDRAFRWSLFLENPDTILIDVTAVKHTLSLINWNAVRAKSCPLTQYTRMTTKKAIGGGRAGAAAAGAEFRGRAGRLANRHSCNADVRAGGSRAKLVLDF